MNRHSLHEHVHALVHLNRLSLHEHEQVLVYMHFHRQVYVGKPVHECGQ
jgi:hypothetical protein